MYLAPPWKSIEPAAPAEPAPVVQPTHGSPYLNPASPKYIVPGVAVISGLAGFVLLVVLYANRNRLHTRLSPLLPWLGARLCEARGISLPMPTSAYLCGLIVRTEPRPARCINRNDCPPPPYDASTGETRDPELPPGLPPPSLDTPSRPAVASSGARATPSPPPAYPPAPPPTPDLALPIAPHASAIHVPASLGLASPPLASPALSVPAAPFLGPPPAYPPLPLPGSHRSSASSVEVGAWNSWTAPWGLVQASSTPRASSVLEARQDAA